MKIFLSTVLLMLTFATIASASTIRKIDFNAQAVEADLIVVGVVEKIEDAAVSGFPFKFATLAVKEVVAGDASITTVKILQPGGKSPKHGRNVRVMGVKYLAVGDENLLFLRKLTDGTYEIIGVSQGQYRVRNGGGRKLVEMPGPSVVKSATLDSVKRRAHAARANAGKAVGK